jgi:hypothetical protein
MKTLTPAVASPTCNVILAGDLPDLSPERRYVVVALVVDRLGRLPGPTRRGVLIVAFAVNLLRVVTTDAVISRLSHLPIPVVGEYFRLLRSLAYTYLWETWPDTSPSGLPTR